MITIAAGYDGSIRIDTRVDTSGFNKGVSSFSGGLSKLKGTLGSIGTAIAGAFLPLTIAAATAAVIKFGSEGVKASTELTNAMMGLQSIIEGQGRSFQKAKGFLDEYVSDGLIPMTNAVTAYKNLASRGYDDSQIQSVMTALKDSSAYGRQSSYSMGEAVQSAAEGLKNENSILVDNAGVTKNVAKMWDDYAKSIGTTANNLTQQQKIQAEVNGIMQETRFQAGDAAKVAGSFSGQLSQLSFHFNELKVAVGDTLIPILKSILPIIDAIVRGLTWVFQKISGVVQLITGQTSDIANSAGDAAGSENDLADGIENASKAAKKAQANFDDLNILQLGLANSGNSGSNGGVAEEINSGLVSALSQGKTAFEDFGNGAALAKNNLDGFKTSLETVKDTALQPIKVSTPEFGKIPSPVYKPNWGLDLPDIKLPSIPMFPSPVFNPEWGLNVPQIMLPTFPLLPTPIYSPAWGFATSLVPELATVKSAVSTVPLTFQTVAEMISVSVGYWNPVVSAAATAVLQTMGAFSSAGSTNMANFGTNIMENAHTAMQMFVDVHRVALSAAGDMFASFVNSASSNYASFGNNALMITQSIGSGMVSVLGSAINFLGEKFNSLKDIAGSVGAKISGWWSDNKSWASPALKVAAMAGVLAVGGVLSGGTALPAIATLGTVALSGIPMLANGAVIPPNNEFLAVLGDQRHGTNIEAPLSTIEEAVGRAIDSRGGGSGGEITIRLIADGKFARAMTTEIDNQSRLRGVKLVTGGSY